MAGYQKGTPELRERTLEVLRSHGGAMQNYQLARIALAEGWPIDHRKMWGTHGLLNTLREEGRVVRVGRGRYAIAESESSEGLAGWDLARKRILATTLATVANSGRQSSRTGKSKSLRSQDLLRTLDKLAQAQDYRCARTGVVFDENDPDLRASLDRINSDGHYDDGTLAGELNNLQLVTHSYNMAKGTRSDEHMARLLRVHATSFLRWQQLFEQQSRPELDRYKRAIPLDGR